MNKELKKAIIEWLLENEDEWQRVIACHDYFRQYVYTPEGNYCIGGEVVSNFIEKADKLIYGQ
jgi:hypothetical protein